MKNLEEEVPVLVNPIHRKLEITSVKKNPYTSNRSIIANSSSLEATVKYQYDGVGYKDNIPVKVSGENFYLDFTKHRHNNLGYVPIEALS